MVVNSARAHAGIIWGGIGTGLGCLMYQLMIISLHCGCALCDVDVRALEEDEQDWQTDS